MKPFQLNSRLALVPTITSQGEPVDNLPLCGAEPSNLPLIFTDKQERIKEKNEWANQYNLRFFVGVQKICNIQNGHIEVMG